MAVSAIESDQNRSGVYEISTPAINELVYYGSAARSISRRWAVHKSDLRKGKHHSPRLQAVVRKHGLSVLVFRVIQNCNPDDCVATEQRYLDSYPRRKLYNINPIAGSRLGAKLTEEQKRRMCVNRGGIGSTEVLTQIISEYQGGTKQADLARKFGVDRASIRNYLKRMRVSIRAQPHRDLQLYRIISQEYLAGHTIRSLARKHGLDYGTLLRILEKSNVQLRPNSQRQKLRFQTTEARRMHSQATGGEIHRFVHRAFGEFIGFPFELAARFGPNCSGNLFQMIKGKRPSWLGWEIADEEGEHKWKCPEQGRVRKLTANQVSDVRELLRQGVTQKFIGAKFHIDQSSIGRIKTGAYRYAQRSFGSRSKFQETWSRT